MGLHCRQLPGVLLRNKVNKMVDSSCGGMLWMPLVIKEVTASNPNFEFMGTDVACSLIEKHRQHFAADPKMKFECIDASFEPLPKGYDLIFSRDSLQHLPYRSVLSFLRNVKASGAKYLLVGSYVTGAPLMQNTGEKDRRCKVSCMCCLIPIIVCEKYTVLQTINLIVI
jgi:hypothetical protein